VLAEADQAIVDRLFDCAKLHVQAGVMVARPWPRDTARQTYHVERRYIELIREEAEAEGVSITEVVNRAFKTYFERK
jgi:pseudouridine-5'-phosphate glycosidase